MFKTIENMETAGSLPISELAVIIMVDMGKVLCMLQCGLFHDVATMCTKTDFGSLRATKTCVLYARYGESATVR